MADSRLLRRLDQVAGRVRWLRGLWTATCGWLILAILIALFRSVHQSSLAWCAVLFGVPTVLLVALLVSARRKSDRQEAAWLIERTYPQLDSRLLTALQQQPRGTDWDFSFLQSELLSELFAQLRRQDWQQAVASSRLWRVQGLHAFALLVCLLFIAPLIRELKTAVATNGTDPVLALTSAPDVENHVSVEPGTIELERGKSLLVLARFAQSAPGQVDLVTRDSQLREVRIPLKKSLDDPLFGGRIASVNDDLTYYVEFDGLRSEEFRVTTFVNPALVKANATVNYPEYTQLPPKTLEDVRQLTLVEGSQLELDCELNKPVRSAILLESESQAAVQANTDDDTAVVQFHLTMTTLGKHHFQLRFTDDDGRTNPEPAEFRVTVVPNRVPDLKVSFPSRDLRVSPLQELELQAQASDDFGLQRLGLIYQTPSGKETSIDFGQSAAPDEAVQAQHLLALEQMQVRPDDLISYYFYAEDIGPDGQLRRSFSDLFFAEVRPFEEIFRQQAPNPSGTASPSPGGAGGELLELQRQVVTASWNVLRRIQAGASEQTRSEIQTLEESQLQVQQTARQAASQLRDAVMQQHAQTAIEQMGNAAAAFSEATSSMDVAALSRGRALAQDAYQSLLKLQARENLVQQSQSQSGQGNSASNRMNQQLQSLKLKNDRDRYETERQARPEPSSSDAATLQILDKLRELARRQEDLNDRIRELETAMNEAASPEEKEELARQLKRLQSEQEELLRQLDETRDQMSQSSERSKMNEARQQADAARERIRRSSEALKQGQTSRALTEGTRAGQELQELEEKIREQTSGRFQDELRQLRADARNLAENEESLARQLEQPSSENSRPQRTLRETSEPAPDGLSEDFARQKEQLQSVLERTKKLVEDSEASEPILSKRLYETLRQLRRDPPEDALEEVVQFTQQGFRSQLADVEQRARAGIQNLQQGIEQAAESILGNEAESLRRAQAELAELREAIRRELALNAPESQLPGVDPPDKASDASAREDASNSPPTASGQPAPGTEETKKPSPSQSGQSGQVDSSSESPRQGSKQSGQGTPSSEMKSVTPGQAEHGQAPSSSGTPSESATASNSGEETRPSEEPSLGESGSNALNMLLGLGGMGNPTGSPPRESPLSGSSYRDWSRRMQDVEEMLTTPQLRSQAAAIRDQARQARIEVKRHSREPDWQLVRTSIYGPLLELESRIAEELARRDPHRQLVPIDRDPVPEKYIDFVRKYYEELSRREAASQ